MCQTLSSVHLLGMTALSVALTQTTVIASVVPKSITARCNRIFVLNIAGNQVVYTKDQYTSRVTGLDDHGYPPIRQHEDKLVCQDLAALPDLFYNRTTCTFDLGPKQRRSQGIVRSGVVHYVQ